MKLLICAEKFKGAPQWKFADGKLSIMLNLVLKLWENESVALIYVFACCVNTRW